ncbi:hypothetical protein E5A73_01415 [Sphingomonas gei]|uniref:Uncharacterized protein n=1 Tax=Sphingomonas gei TaxID=1395960 RepID=A0A4S1XKU5_9SPHN|nr:hypothetical protein [Sphingomonas gei]TGX55816.1 hypothetical protein E5A73_01415 [Sphingomonas gei]
MRLLAEYEAARAHIVTVKFRSKVENKAFSKIARTSPVEAMRATGYPEEARRVILNTITMAMVSDCLHHLYEALRCMEKRKVIVAHNLLRKPLTDNLMYLSWMLGDEDAFYATFTAEDGDAVISRAMASQRFAILETTLAALPISNVLTAAFVHRSLFDRNNPSGLYGLFQHAVHLVTAKHAELRTEAENFNFIFKNYADDDLYELLYDILPQLMLYLAHVIAGLFDRMRPMDAGAHRAFEVRSILGLYFVEGGENEGHALAQLENVRGFHCAACKHPFSLTPHNGARLVLSESYRCVSCRRVQPFPYSWLF